MSGDTRSLFVGSLTQEHSKEYEAAEQEKFEAKKAKDDVAKKKTLDKRIEEPKYALVNEQSNERFIHAVTDKAVKGERAVTSIKERSPSWISAAVTESIEHVEERNSSSY
ncbi:UNVERIFIED_CONTAM: hypothetical protein K2H54_038554 [Gekko kuhli]